MLNLFVTFAAWEAEALSKGLKIELNGFEDVGTPESGPDLSYTPDFATRACGGEVEVVGAWIEPIAKGCFAGSADELTKWIDSLCGECGTEMEAGGCPHCGDF